MGQYVIPEMRRQELLVTAFRTLRELGMLYEDPNVPGTYLVINDDRSPAGRLAKKLLRQGVPADERLAALLEHHPRSFKRFIAER